VSDLHHQIKPLFWRIIQSTLEWLDKLWSIDKIGKEGKGGKKMQGKFLL
jgi:hypothetical protein